MTRNPTERAHLPPLTVPAASRPVALDASIPSDVTRSLKRLRVSGVIDELEHMASVLRQRDMPDAAQALDDRALSLSDKERRSHA